ncbi:MAG: N-acetylmuramoyl-L-alanine amidase [Rhizobium sp.]|nr:N-acetylmuramoyl-L-alanine amidase [Rhizobium sp.]
MRGGDVQRSRPRWGQRLSLGRQFSRIAVVLLLAVAGTAANGNAMSAVQAQPADPLAAYAARIVGDRARTRIVLEFDRKPEIAVRYIARPDRIVVDLPSTVFTFPEADLEARGLFRDIRYGSMDADSARLVLTADRPARLVASEVKANESGEGYRLVLDAEMVSQQDFEKLVKDQTWMTASVDTTATAQRGDRIAQSEPAAPGAFVIAIDAGHGGIDAGATGAATKTQEKEITLAFAKALFDRLKGEPGIEAFLVREGDEFLSLSERVTIARQRGANLLISFHADTLRQGNIRGATVYTISDKASDRMAADLAERENLSDAVGGVSETGEPAEVSDILLDLTRRETQAFSISMADSVVRSFEGQVALINNPHRYAGFRVLQAHDVPSILLELGFLSNKEDEKLLLDPAWRVKIADLLATAIRRYRLPVVANGG